MSDTNGNGNGKTITVGSAITRELGSFTIAEIAAEGIFFGALALEQIVPQSMMKPVTRVVSKTCIEPFLDNIEYGLGKICKLEACRPDPSIPREKRADDIARMMLLAAPAIAVSWWAKLEIRHLCNDKFGIKEIRNHPPKDSSILYKLFHRLTFQHYAPEEKMVFLMDEGLHLGGLYFLNNHLHREMDTAIQGITGILQKTLGISPRAAHEQAVAACEWMLPNAIGALGGTLAIFGKHKFGWPLKHTSRAFSDHIPPTLGV